MPEYNNLVRYFGQTVVDLTNDTAEAADVRTGKTFHAKSGAPTTGAWNGVNAESLSVTENGTYTASSGKVYTSVTANVPIGQSSIKLSTIAVTTPPSKTSYADGESFNSSGMVILATYTNGATKNATGYTVSPDPLTAGTTAVTISFTDGGETKTATQAVTVV